MSDTVWIITFAVGGVLVLILWLMAQGKKKRSKKSLQEARDALNAGDDSRALLLFKYALDEANEEPDLEESILSSIETLYTRHQVQYDFANYRKLIEQGRFLSKRGSNKSLDEYLDVQKLKQELAGKMPHI